LQKRLPLLEKFYKAGIRAVFSGHYHRNAYGKYKTLDQVGTRFLSLGSTLISHFPQITTSATGRPLGDDPSGFRIVKVIQTSATTDKQEQPQWDITHKYFGLDEVPHSVRL
jgi:hypothetical protein